MKHIKLFEELKNSLYEELSNINNLESDISLPFSEKAYKSLSHKLCPDLFNKYGDWEDDGYYPTYKIGNYDVFQELSSHYENFKVLKYIKKLSNNKDLTLCDMGCGLGTFIYFCNKMGIKSYGVEYLKKYKEIHDKIQLDVKYGNFFEMNLSFLKKIDIVYLYRPIEDPNTMGKLLELIYNNTKDDVILVFSDLQGNIDIGKFKDIQVINDKIGISSYADLFILIK
jgi:2-polyprenyl-3-methyl-5-hydroxy-6-metoxy-1,4-benzoquinol methylase